MRWLIPGLVVAALAIGCSTERTPDELDDSCPDQTASAFLDGDGSDVVATARAALGDRLDDAHEVTEEPNDDKGFETVTFRGYDVEGELMMRVVVEGSDTGGWRVARVDTCH